MKTRNIFGALLLLVMALGIVSCKDDDNGGTANATKLVVLKDSVEVSQLQFSIGMGSAILGINCDGDWTASLADTTWAKLAVHAGYGYTNKWSYTKLEVLKNEGDARSTTLTVTSGGLSKVITINQNGTGTDPGDTFMSGFAFVEAVTYGYNLGNTLDSNPIGDWWDPTTKSPTDWEQGWGQPITTPEIIGAIASKGFNVIRVPVTWKPHMDSEGNVDAAWMARVKEVVDMVINAGCYCVVNVQHDTGGDTSAWLQADMASYPTSSPLFKKLWTQIATTFRDYGDHLLFEAFNEILNANFSWTPPSAGSTDYEAMRRLHQDFVDAVRATGGNNVYRNLVVNPYSAGNSQVVLDEMALPTDVHPNHIIGSVHSYDPYNFCNDNGEWSIYVWDSSCEEEIDAIFARVSKRFGDLGMPYFFGEFGAIDEGKSMAERIKYAKYLATKFNAYNTSGLWWMGLINRRTLTWYEEEIVDALFQTRAIM